METWEEEEAPTAVGDIPGESHSEDAPEAQDAAQEILADQQVRDSEGHRREDLDLADPEDGVDRSIMGPEDGVGQPRLPVDGAVQGEAAVGAQHSYWYLSCCCSFFVNAAQNQQETSSVAVSRTERTAITGTETYGEWYQDDLGYIDHDTDLTDGLKYFYSQTGIQPYVMLLDYDPDMWKDGKWNESAAETCLAGIYNDTFSDNGHLIFAYFACENDSEDMNGTFYFYYGSAAYSIMDDEAEDIFWSYFDMNYNDLDQSIAEFIGKTFEETADNIMHNSKNSDISLIEIIPVFLAVSVVVIVICVVVIWNMKKKEL